jgi:hypothetical protein
MHLVVVLLAAVSAAADPYDGHRAAVLDHLLRAVPSDHRLAFVRARDECTQDPARQPGCVDLGDEALRFLRQRGHRVDRVPEMSRYYIYGHPSTHRGEWNAPPPDWVYLPMYTPAAEWRTYCEVRVHGHWPPRQESMHVGGYCTSGERGGNIFTSGDFIVKRDGRRWSVERFEPPPGCVLPDPPPP